MLGDEGPESFPEDIYWFSRKEFDRLFRAEAIGKVEIATSNILNRYASNGDFVPTTYRADHWLRLYVRSLSCLQAAYESDSHSKGVNDEDAQYLKRLARDAKKLQLSAAKPDFQEWYHRELEKYDSTHDALSVVISRAKRAHQIEIETPSKRTKLADARVPSEDEPSSCAEYNVEEAPEVSELESCARSSIGKMETLQDPFSGAHWIVGPYNMVQYSAKTTIGAKIE